MKHLLFITSALFIFTLSGCASVTTSSMQPLSVNTKTQSGTPVAQAKCTLKNEKGEWSVITPNTVSVQKAGGNLAVNCKKPGLPEGNARAISRAGAGMYGNIIIGGGVGALIDHSSGKAYVYPDKVNVTMGDTITIDRHDPGVNIVETNPEEDKRTNAAAGSDDY